jgi:hypothetical protein
MNQKVRIQDIKLNQRKCLILETLALRFMGAKLTFGMKYKNLKPPVTSQPYTTQRYFLSHQINTWHQPPDRR